MWTYGRVRVLDAGGLQSGYRSVPVATAFVCALSDGMERSSALFRLSRLAEPVGEQPGEKASQRGFTAETAGE
jgi:hypothetical protein